MSRVLAAARLHTVAWPLTLSWPWGIMASSFLLNLAIFGAIGDRMEGDAKTGGLLSLYITMAIVAGSSVTQVFPYALGMSVTRRTFYAATALVMTALSMAFAVPLYLLKLLEQATGGWGLSMRFFAVDLMDVHNGLLQVLVYAVPLLFVCFFGMFSGVVFARWGINGVFAMTVAGLLSLGLVALVITWSGAWRTAGHWFADQPPAALFAGWPMLLVLALAGGGYALLRRAQA